LLITIRHGETDYNVNKLYSGNDDAPRLTAKGHIDAYNVGKELNQYKIDIAIVSPLTRAIETYNEINKSINVDYVIDSNLVERDFKAYNGKPFEVIDKHVYLDVNKQDVYDIETIKEMVKRVKIALNNIKNNYKDKNVLIVAHSQICKVIKYIIEGEKETNLNNYRTMNLQISIYKEW
jgi:probable phosphoglycerate mutase